MRPVRTGGAACRRVTAVPTYTVVRGGFGLGLGLAEDIDGVSTVMSGVDALMGEGVVAVAAMLVVVAGAEVAIMVMVAGVGDDVMVVVGRGGVVVAATVA